MLNMKLERIRKNMSQQELADAIGVKSHVVSRWETGVNYPSIENLLKVSEVLNVSVDYLLGKVK